jgi:hypothetical protein
MGLGVSILASRPFNVKISRHARREMRCAGEIRARVPILWVVAQGGDGEHALRLLTVWVGESRHR